MVRFSCLQLAVVREPQWILWVAMPFIGRLPVIMVIVMQILCTPHQPSCSRFLVVFSVVVFLSVWCAMWNNQPSLVQLALQSSRSQVLGFVILYMGIWLIRYFGKMWLCFRIPNTESVMPTAKNSRCSRCPARAGFSRKALHLLLPVEYLSVTNVSSALSGTAVYRFPFR